MTEHEPHQSPRLSHIKDTRGRKVTQLDPVAMHFLMRHDMIPPEPLREIAEHLDPGEVRKRRWASLRAVIMVVLTYLGFFGYFYIFKRWRGWDPVLIMFAVSYFVFPPVGVYLGFRRARQARHERIRRVMLEHLRCPHCGYDIRGLPVDPTDGATVCPECGCAWRLDSPTRYDSRKDNGMLLPP